MSEITQAMSASTSFEESERKRREFQRKRFIIDHASKLHLAGGSNAVAMPEIVRKQYTQECVNAATELAEALDKIDLWHDY